VSVTGWRILPWVAGWLQPGFLVSQWQSIIVAAKELPGKEPMPSVDVSPQSHAVSRACRSQTMLHTCACMTARSGYPASRNACAFKMTIASEQNSMHWLCSSRMQHLGALRLAWKFSRSLAKASPPLCTGREQSLLAAPAIELHLMTVLRQRASC
jgi:hypothetical protein